MSEEQIAGSLAAPAPTIFRFARRVLVTLTVQDGVATAFFAVLWLAAFFGRGRLWGELTLVPLRRVCLSRTGAGLLVLMTTLVAVRGGLLGPRASAWLYRLVLYACLQLSYFMLRDLLPVVSDRLLDAPLARLDAQLFGVEPTLWTDHLVNGPRTEWFSFFYLSYFAVFLVHVVPVVFFERREVLLDELSFGIIVLFCVGQSLYLLVPGFGPHRFLAASFVHALPDGPFHHAMMRAVATGGAQKDIFPSLHTAVPTFLALFSFRHRRFVPFRWTWPIVVFFGFNIVGATIFLRWHYAVDVFGGAALAVVAFATAIGVTRWERARRVRDGVGPIWPPWPVSRVLGGDP